MVVSLFCFVYWLSWSIFSLTLKWGLLWFYICLKTHGWETFCWSTANSWIANAISCFKGWHDCVCYGIRGCFASLFACTRATGDRPFSPSLSSEWVNFGSLYNLSFAWTSKIMYGVLYLLIIVEGWISSNASVRRMQCSIIVTPKICMPTFWLSKFILSPLLWSLVLLKDLASWWSKTIWEYFALMLRSCSIIHLILVKPHSNWSNGALFLLELAFWFHDWGSLNITFCWSFLVN